MRAARPWLAVREAAGVEPAAGALPLPSKAMAANV